MYMNKKTILLPVALAAASGILLFGAAGTNAQDTGSGYSTIVQKLAARFGLNENDVQSVFYEAREERHEQMETRMQERLNQAVGAGDLTDAQRRLLLERHEEMEQERLSERESVQNMTHEQRREHMQEKHEEMENWAEENDIDLPELGQKDHKGMFGGRYK